MANTPENDSRDSAAQPFFAELKKRKVFQVGGTYLIVGWLIIQVAVAVFPHFDIPTWATRFVILSIAAGFPIALVLAWAFELTPEGVKTTRQARDLIKSAHEPASGELVRRRNRLALLTGILLPVFLLGIILGAVALSLLGRADPVAAIAMDPAASLQPVVAVLPFTNMSPDPHNAFFADGVHEDLLTNLSRIGALRVISSTSVNRYRDSQHPLRQIAAELGATHIIEGSVRRMDNRVRVSAQLIASDSDEHIWAERFDRELKDIFAIQSQLADEIARALEARLTASERDSLDDTPTHSVAAYDSYLQARQRMTAIEDNEARFAEIVGLLNRAVQLDADFADAWSLLAWVHASLVHFDIGEPEYNLARSWNALQRAQALAPDRVETLLGETYYYYHGLKDLDRALEVVSRAISREPGRADPLAARGYILRRMGRLSDGLLSLQKAAELDPLNSGLLAQILVQVRIMGNFHEAYAITQRLIALNPDAEGMSEMLFGMRMVLHPDIPEVVEWAQRMESGIEQIDQGNFEQFMTMVSVYLLVDDIPRAEGLLRFIDRSDEAIRPDLEVALYYSFMRFAEFRRRDERAQQYHRKLAASFQRLQQNPNSPTIPNYRIWLDTVGMLLAMRDGNTSKADDYLQAIVNTYESQGIGMQRAESRQSLVRAKVIRQPEQAWEIYQREQLQEAKGVTFEIACSTLIDWTPLFQQPGFIQQLVDSPAHHQMVKTVAPFLLED